jgi:hypothetical protein
MLKTTLRRRDQGWQKNLVECVRSNMPSHMPRKGAKLHKEQWCERVPKSVETSRETKAPLLWNEEVKTDRAVPNNKPGIKIRVDKKGTCVLLDTAISGDFRRNLIKKEVEIILKCEDVTAEIQSMWNVITKVMPVIIRATGTISEPLR